MLHLLQMVPFKVINVLLPIRSLRQLSSCNCSPRCAPAFPGGSTSTNTVSSSSGFSSLYISTVQPAPSGPGYSALRSDRTHCRSGILSPDDPHASGGVIILIKQGLFFHKLSTSSLSSLDSFLNYVGVNISLNNSFSLSFLNAYASPIRSFLMDSRTDSFSPFVLSSSRKLCIMEDFNCHYSSSTQKVLINPVGGSIQSDHLLRSPYFQ